MVTVHRSQTNRTAQPKIVVGVDGPPSSLAAPRMGGPDVVRSWSKIRAIGRWANGPGDDLWPALRGASGDV